MTLIHIHTFFLGAKFCQNMKTKNKKEHFVAVYYSFFLKISNYNFFEKWYFLEYNSSHLDSAFNLVATFFLINFIFIFSTCSKNLSPFNSQSNRDAKPMMQHLNFLIKKLLIRIGGFLILKILKNQNMQFLKNSKNPQH
jgi:hypothetical protein